MGESIYISILKRKLLIYIFKKIFGGFGGGRRDGEGYIGELEGWGWEFGGMGMGKRDGNWRDGNGGYVDIYGMR